MKRGEIWDIEFPLIERENAEPYGHGPVVIVSSDVFNASLIKTVLVAILTSNLKLGSAPGNVVLLADALNGLRNDSVINVSQVLVVDKIRLERRRGRLDDVSRQLLDAGLLLVMGLP
ncbi:type II toxin-antitoxin system PemK/MazF family toxin [Deinococcus aquatilis]|uniref:type II toxin-antitoxin system PemK/MazF family toxin n=1 Tax=Deinococcus aquatilis TaxID=519440 RepID=UPI0004765295|nr:type II toxin-antitoxin system PemK/MazF family toxin [Deinococcus aquatilis]